MNQESITFLERMDYERTLELRATQQSVVAELGQKILTKGETKLHMDLILQRVSGTFDVEYDKILEILPGQENVLLRAGRECDDGLVERAIMPLGRGIRD